MPIHETFTKRKRMAAKAGQPEIYTYDQLPSELRTQVAYIWRDAIGGYHQVTRYDYLPERPSNVRWRVIQEIVARERGVFSLSGQDHNPHEQCLHMLMWGDTDSALEIIEASFRLIDTSMRQFDAYDRRQEGLKQDADEAIAELNQRFKEHGIGYRYEEGVLVRVDSELLHAEVTLPALRLLHSGGFKGAQEEFLSAHEPIAEGKRRTRTLTRSMLLKARSKRSAMSGNGSTQAAQQPRTSSRW